MRSAPALPSSADDNPYDELIVLQDVDMATLWQARQVLASLPTELADFGDEDTEVRDTTWTPARPRGVSHA